MQILVIRLKDFWGHLWQNKIFKLFGFFCILGPQKVRNFGHWRPQITFWAIWNKTIFGSFFPIFFLQFLAFLAHLPHADLLREKFNENIKFKEIKWEYIVDFYNFDERNGIRMAPKQRIKA